MDNRQFFHNGTFCRRRVVDTDAPLRELGAALRIAVDNLGNGIR